MPGTAPTSSSFVKGPYTSDVSNNVTPSSKALWIVAVLSSSVTGLDISFTA